MALDKAIEHGKERRKPYRRSKAIDKTCRNHGSCEWCEKNRKHKFRDKNYTEQEIIEETQDYSQLSYELLQKLSENSNRVWEEFVEDYNKCRVEKLKEEIARLEERHEMLLMNNTLLENVPMPKYNVAPIFETEVLIFNGD